MLKDKYIKEAIPEMRKRFGYASVMAVPRIEKAAVNTGFGRLVSGKTSDEHKKLQSSIMSDLGLICGQKPVAKKSKKSISGFKLREGLEIGAACTLRGRKMFDFLDRLINVALPRSRDFQGIDVKSFDGKGNLTLGVKEHIAFPEVTPEKAKTIFGLEITVVTNAKSRDEGIELLKLLKFPIKI